MDANQQNMVRKIIPLGLFGIYFILYLILGYSGWILPFELFNLMLLGSCGAVAARLAWGDDDLLIGAGVIIIIASHGLIGQKLAPDSLTSGAILMVNILILYVGIKIFENLSLTHFSVFVVSYFLLFFIFIKQLDNAEALFLLALMGLAATARDYRLLTYFWALVFSFTFCQPYAWQAALISFFVLKVIFSVKKQMPSKTISVFLVWGLALVFLVLFPVLVLVLNEDPRNIINMLKLDQVRSAILLTLLTASISTVVLAVFCIPFAYALSRSSFWGKTALLSLIDVPIIIPQSAAGIAILRIFGKQQFIGEVLYNNLGIRVDGTVIGICLAQVFVALPFITKGAMAAFGSIPPALEQSARTLGASSFGAFWRIAVPLSLRGLFVSGVLAWARAAGEFGAVYFVAAYPETAPITVFNRFESVGLAETAPLVSTLILFSLLMFFMLQFAVRLMPDMYKRDVY